MSRSWFGNGKPHPSQSVSIGKSSQRSLSPRGHIRSTSARDAKKSNQFPPRSQSAATISVNQRRESLQKKIHVLSIAKSKIDKLKNENSDLKQINLELQEKNHELKNDMNAQTDIIYNHERRIRAQTVKIVKLEKENKAAKSIAIENSNINDILYKVSGDSEKKLKYTSMKPKFVVFISTINHLFYYDQFGKELTKCIVVRDISIDKAHIAQEMDLRNGKPWFLIVGIKRTALFVTESIATRDKWVNFIAKSIGKAVIPSSTPSVTQSTSSKYASSSSGGDKLDIITSPRNGNTQVVVHDGGVFDGFETNAMSFCYPAEITNCSLANNGYSIQVNIPSLNKCNLIINNRKSEMYTLREFHFHTPSQYNLHSKPHEMEMHAIHTTEDKKIIVLVFVFTTKQKYMNPKIVLNSSKTHWIFPPKIEENVQVKSHSKTESVLGILKMKKKTKKIVEKMDESEDDETDIDDGDCDEQQNDFLQQFWDQMPLKKAKKNTPLSTPLNFDYLFKTASDNFSRNVKTNEINLNMDLYEFDGCLRHPPYTEGVKWYISKKTHFINEPQLNKLKKIWFSFL